MRLNHYQKLAAGKLLESLGDDPRVASIEIDGKPIEAAPELLAFYRDRMDTAGRSRLTAALDERAGKIATDAERLRNKIEAKGGWLARGLAWFRTSKVGQRLVSWVLGPVENVHYEAKAKIALKDGKVIELSVPVDDARARLTLERLSILAEMPTAIPGIPFVGLVLPALSAAVAAVGGAVTRIAGDVPLSDALFRMSRKHGLMLSSNLFPVVGALIPAAAVVADAAEVRALTAPATVKDIVGLRSLAEGARDAAPARRAPEDRPE